MTFTLEPISLTLGLSAAAGVAVLQLVRRLRRGMRALRDDLRVAQGRVLVSEALLTGEEEALSAALPAVGLLAGSVTAIFPVSTPGQRSRLLVASPPDSDDASIRAAAALLAAVSVSTAEVPEFARAVRSGLPQRGVDLGALLRRGVTSLPYTTRDKLFERLKRTPFVVVPIARPDGGGVAGLLVALAGTADLERLTASLVRVAGRLAWLLPSLRKGPLRAEAGAERKPRSGRPPAPRDAEVILWLDAKGEVAGCEALQEAWTMEPPRSLHDLFGVSNSSRLLERASREAPVALGLARIDADTLAEVSILRLADADENTWGYTAFLRRVDTPLGASETSPDSSGSSRSASLPS